MALDYFKAITGKLVVKGYEPDGDSVRFIADNAAHFAELHRGHLITPSKRDGSVQLRLEGIDAPETHYGSAAQPYGNTARDRFLNVVGFTAWQLAKDGKTATSSTPDQVSGLILTRAADIHGRPISYVLVSSSHHFKDGDEGSIGTTVLKETANYRMLQSGDAYGLFYSSTPLQHRHILRAAAHAARAEGRGLWPQDMTELFKLRDQDSIGPEGSLIMPKLFRRCTDFLKVADKAQVGFDLADWLLDNPSEDDKLFVETQHGSHRLTVPLHAVIEQHNGKLSFQLDVLDVVFIEK